MTRSPVVTAVPVVTAQVAAFPATAVPTASRVTVAEGMSVWNSAIVPLRPALPLDVHVTDVIPPVQFGKYQMSEPVFPKFATCPDRNSFHPAGRVQVALPLEFARVMTSRFPAVDPAGRAGAMLGPELVAA